MNFACIMNEIAIVDLTLFQDIMPSAIIKKDNLKQTSYHL